MRHSIWRNVLVPVVLLVLVLPAGGDEPAAWRAGFAKARITPEEPLWLAGYAARTHPADGTLHDLWVKALALEDAQGHRAVIVTSDLLGFSKPLYERILAEVEPRCRLTRSQVMLNASHTHSGPVLDNALVDVYPLDEKQQKLIGAYTEDLEKAVVATIARAVESMRPARLSLGQGQAGFAANRRALRSAPTAAGRPAVPAPVDHAVPVLAVRDLEGNLQVVLFGYACHCTTLDIYQWNGDYAGFAQLALEGALPGAEAMFFQGCGGDQNPHPRRTVALCRQYGGELAAGVKEVLGGPMKPVAAELRTAFAFVRLDFGDPPTREYLEQTAAGSGYRARWATRLLARIKRGEPLEKDYPYPVQVWRLGREWVWIALSGEVVVDYSLRLKRQYGSTTWVAGYSNDVMAYIPSRRVWEEGGYEAGAFDVYGLPAMGWSGEIEERITSGVDRLVRQVEARSAAGGTN